MKSLFLALAMLALGLAAEAQKGPTTRVDIASQPERASVVVDGVDRGLSPITLFDLSPGRHHLKFRLAGYAEQDRLITVEEGRPSQHSDVLEPERGLLLVKSDPAGCEITIDGVAMGLTPRLITTLNAKDVYRMTLRKTGYQPATFEVKFSGRTPLVRDETLLLDSGVLDLVSEPSGAEVSVNGIVRGRTPVVVDNVPKGRATVRFTLDGFKDEIVSDLVVGAGDRQTVSRILEGLPGTLAVSSVPEGARLYINDEYRGKSPLVLAGLQPGEYAIRAEMEGYADESRLVKVDNGAAPRVEFRLMNVMGGLEVRTAPSGAQVIFDGRPVGMTSTGDQDAEFSDVLRIDGILEGEHTLVVKKDGYAEHVRHPKIQRGKTSKVNARLKRIFKPDAEIVTNGGTYQGILISNTPESVVMEVKLGIERSFPRAEIISFRFLDGEAK